MPLTNEQPSQGIVSAAARIWRVTDKEGRVLEVKRPGALDRLRLFKAVGPVLAENARYVGYGMLAMCVQSIDGVPVPAPATEGQLEALVDRLGDVGLVAVGDALDPPEGDTPGNA